MIDIKYLDSITSSYTRNKRNAIKGIDQFCTFSWNGINAFDAFGAFIIGNKEGVGTKFFNGPSFTNKYSSPQFDKSKGDLLGIDFKQQQISFKIGVYWISIAQYQCFLSWLDPYEVGTLEFGYNDYYGYLVKLAKREDSTRYVVGQEPINISSTQEKEGVTPSFSAINLGDTIINNKQIAGTTQPMYYTEMNLTFDIIGDSCAIAKYPYEWKTAKVENKSEWESKINTTIQGGTQELQEYIQSQLDFPFTYSFTIPIENIVNPYFSFSLKVKIQVQNRTNEDTYAVEGEQELFAFNMINWKISDPKMRIGGNLSFIYDSLSGLLYLKHGESRELVTLLTTNASGERLFSSITSHKFKWPGIFNTQGYGPFLKDDNIKLILASDENIPTTLWYNEKDEDVSSKYISIEAHGRTLIA